eukprot:5609371-Prorocentrum_lima.AAC.1
MEFDPANSCYARFVDNINCDLDAATQPGSTPINIQGEAFQVCLHCAGYHLAENEYLFIDLKATVNKQKSLGTLREKKECKYTEEDFKINKHTP